MFRIMDSADPDNYATSRELTIPETLVVDAYDNNREIPSDGVFIGVTGFPVFSEFNAALWGMTQVDGKLAATGAEVDGLGMLGVGLAVVGLAAFVLRRARQRSV
jgi:LPXTG-motif cell wall-anchored protein